jgi:NAD(P)-dependent dehydrogenase (short-subunit alcohol dehydrogenase family)
MHLNFESLQSINPHGSVLRVLDTSDADSSSFSDGLTNSIEFLNSSKIDEARCVIFVAIVSNSNPWSSVVCNSIKGLVGSASLEFASHRGRVNLVIANSSTPEADLKYTLDYLNSESAGGFTTGNVLDLTNHVWKTNKSSKRALVTGGAGGLGYAAAKAFSEAGYSVLLSDLPSDGLNRAGQELGAEVFGANLSEVAEIKSLLEHAGASGGVDALVLHHGVGGSTWLGQDFDLKTASRSINVNGSSFMRTAEIFMKMELSHNASVVCLSSIAGLTAEAGHAAYSAPKFAVVELVRQFRGELSKRNSTIHALCPGPIRTALMEQAFAGLAKGLGQDPEEFTKKRLASIPLGDAGTPEQIGNSALYLSRLSATGLELAPTGGEVLV